MARAHRIERLQREILRELGMILLRELNDPRIGRVTLTRVKLSPDLSSARVFYTAPPEEKTRRRIESGLRHALGFLQQRLGENLAVRTIPALSFQVDTDLDRTERMNEIFADLARQRRAAGEADAPAGGDEEK